MDRRTLREKGAESIQSTRKRLKKKEEKQGRKREERKGAQTKH